MTTIPFLKVSGSHFSCGEQIGQHFSDQIHLYLGLCKNDPPKNMSWQDCLDQTRLFYEPTQKYFPQIVDEIRGVAKGSNLDFTELFALTIEEFYTSYYPHHACTDMIFLPPSSQHTIVAHNNDLPATFSKVLTTVEWNFDDGSRMFTVGLAGYMASVGVNNSKIVLSGNELTPTDTSIGIPRALIARAILLARTYDEAIATATHPARASSYNNIITVPGRSVSIEGSAKNYELVFPNNGVLTHSNHYCSPKMLKYEGNPNHTSSIERLASANRIVGQSDKPIDLQTAESFLKSHDPSGVGDDNTICRHGETAITTFGFAVDLEEGVVEVASGNPCQNVFEKVWQL